MKDMNEAKALTATLALSLASVLALAGCNGGHGGTAITTTTDTGVTAVEVWDVQGPNNLAIQGYDPVAYFPEGGGAPTQGDPSISHTTSAGVTYHFASDNNRQRFINNPDKYTPANGGWCAYCITDDVVYTANPKSFLIRENQLLLFYTDDSLDTRQRWLDEKDDAAHVAKANQGWDRLNNKDGS